MFFYTTKRPKMAEMEAVMIPCRAELQSQQDLDLTRPFPFGQLTSLKMPLRCNCVLGCQVKDIKAKCLADLPSSMYKLSPLKHLQNLLA